MRLRVVDRFECIMDTATALRRIAEQQTATGGVQCPCGGLIIYMKPPAAMTKASCDNCSFRMVGEDD